MKKYKPLLLILLFANLCFSALSQDCENDTIPPVVACINLLQVTLPPSGSIDIWATDLLAAATDNCSDSLDFYISEGVILNEPPTTSLITFSENGIFYPELWAVDEAGNWSTCWTELIVGTVNQDCAADTIPPVAVCDAELNITLPPTSNSITLYPQDLNDGSYDNCSSFLEYRISEGSTSNEPPPANSTSINFDTAGTYFPVLWVADEAENWSQCWMELNIADNPQSCQNDTIAPVIICNQQVDIEFDQAFGQSLLFLWDAIAETSDNCTFATPSFAPSNNYQILDSIAIFDSLGIFDVTVLVTDQASNVDSCNLSVNVSSPFPDSSNYRISGQVVRDLDEDCTVNNGDQPLENWLVELWAGDTKLTAASTSTLGQYELYYFPTGSGIDSVQVRLALTPSLPQFCPLTYTIAVEDLDTETPFSQDFTVRLLENCPALQVDLASPFLRRCFPSEYSLQYCNYGTETATDARIEVTLDDFLSFAASSIPASLINEQDLAFDIGDVAAGECGSFRIFVDVSCDAELGQTHCSEARIYPDTLCGEDYAGPQIVVEGRCDEANEEVVFRLTNVGDAPMAQERNYFVVEDVIMYMQSPFNLNSGDSVIVNVPANGATYTLEAEQPADYPWTDIFVSSVEGCGSNGNGGFSTGVVTQFGPVDHSPFVAIDCQQNIGAYDPNDKQAWPRGIGEAHLLPRDRPIDYRIRFQNTGTDTAFTVVVLDTLSPWLDLSSVRPGASSHPYTFKLREDRVLEFRFDNILLPDSTTNLAASQGFVQFSTGQQPDNPDGTLIENDAAIYFDFNEPIITNTVFHTIGELFVTSTQEEAPHGRSLRLFPNPFSGQATIQLPKATQGQFAIFQLNGQQVYQQDFSGQSFQFTNSVLPSPGLYLYTVRTREGVLYQGKLIAQD